MAANSYVRGRRVRGHDPIRWPQQTDAVASGLLRDSTPSKTGRPLLQGDFAVTINTYRTRVPRLRTTAGAGFRRGGSGANIAASLIDYGVGQAGLGSPEFAMPRQY